VEVDLSGLEGEATEKGVGLEQSRQTTVDLEGTAYSSGDDGQVNKRDRRGGHTPRTKDIARESQAERVTRPKSILALPGESVVMARPRMDLARAHGAPE